MDTATSVRDLLIHLALKVGVACPFAALLARWNTFRRVLFTKSATSTKTQVDDVHGSSADRRRDAAPGRACLQVCGSVAGRRVSSWALLVAAWWGPIGGAIITIPA